MADLLSQVTLKPWIPSLFLWIRKGFSKLDEKAASDEMEKNEFNELRKWRTNE